MKGEGKGRKGKDERKGNEEAKKTSEKPVANKMLGINVLVTFLFL